MSDNDFMRRQREAVEQMREMNSRAAPAAGQPSMSVPPFVKLQGNRQNRSQSAQQAKNRSAAAESAETGKPGGALPISRQEEPEKKKSGGIFGGLDLPFLDMFAKDGDLSLIIGLLLILVSEKADKKLLFALVYILM